MAFLEDVLPVDIRPGATGGPGFSTTIKQLRGGGEYRNQLWRHPLRTFEVEYGSRTRQRIEEELQSFIFRTGGAFSGFRARDWSDYTATDEQIGVGDGTTFWFRLYKQYGTYQRRILKPDPNTVTIRVNGTTQDAERWVVDADNGVVVFRDAPPALAVIEWSGEFHVPVRFDADNMTINMLMHTKGTVSGVGLREIRLNEVIDTDEFDTIREYLAAFDRTELIAMLDALGIHVNTNWPDIV